MAARTTFSIPAASRSNAAIDERIGRRPEQALMVAGGYARDGRWLDLRAAVGVLAIALCACSSLPDAGGSSAEAKSALVKQRAEARWTATIKGDNIAAYAYLSPGSKSLMPLEQYILKAPRNIRSASVTGVECGADSCKVTLELKYDAALVKGVVTPHLETWVLENGQWWYVHRI
jgi:hypothetical protein